MKKSALLLLVFSAITAAASAQSFIDTPQIQTSRLMNLAGKIDSIATLILSMKVMEAGAGLQTSVVSGNKIITVPDTALTLLEERVLKFNDAGALIEERVSKTNGKTAALKAATHTKYTFKKGILINKATYAGNALSDSVTYTYREGRLWMQDVYNSRKKLEIRTQYGLNPDKKLLTISSKDADNILVNMMRLKYNEQYELVEATLHDNTLKPVSTRTFVVEHDTAGRRHVMIFDFAKPDTATGMTSYLLDDNDNHLEDVMQDEQKKVISYSTARYDSLNNAVEQTIFTTEKLNVAYSYVYDLLGNWIEKRIYHNGAPYQMIRRTIYYRPEEKP